MFLRLFFVASMCQISGKTGGRAMGPHVLFSPFRAPMGHDAMVWSMVHHGSVMGMSRNSVWHQAAIAADPSLTFSLGNYSLVSRGRGLKKWCHAGRGRQGAHTLRGPVNGMARRVQAECQSGGHGCGLCQVKGGSSVMNHDASLANRTSSVTQDEPPAPELHLARSR